MPGVNFYPVPGTQEPVSALSLPLMPALHPRGSHQPAHCQWCFLAWHLIPLNLPAKLLHPRSSPQFALPLYHPSSEGSATPVSSHDMGCIFNLDFNSSSFSCLYLPVPVPQGAMLICFSHLNWYRSNHFKNCLGEI